MSEIQARYLESSEYPRWDRFVGQLPSTTIFDETAWTQPLCDIFSCELKVLAVFKGKELLGGITFSTGKRFGKTIATRVPLCPTNSCVISPSSSLFPSKETSHILQATEAIARFLKVNFPFTVVTNNRFLTDIRSFLWEGWMPAVQYTYLIDLGSISLSNIPPARKSKIVKARQQLSVKEIDSPDTAYSLLQKTYTRKDVHIPLTRKQMAEIHARFGREKIVMLCAFLNDGTPVATEIILTDESRKRAYNLLAGMDPTYRDTNAAFLTKWEMIELLQKREFAMLDLVGAENKTVALYKSHFEGQLVPYYQVWHAGTGYRIMNLLATLNPFKKR